MNLDMKLNLILIKEIDKLECVTEKFIDKAYKEMRRNYNK